MTFTYATVVDNWQWGIVALAALWFLRWYVAERRGLVNFGRLGRPANPFQVIAGAVVLEVRQNTRRATALAAFVFGGLFVLINTVGFSINFLTMLDPATWFAALVGVFGVVRLAGFDVPVVIGMLAVAVIGGAVISFDRRRR